MSKYSKLGVPILKAQLKEAGMIQSGEKQTLVWRLGIRDKSNAANLKTWDDEDPCTINEGKLRKACAKEGVSCIGNRDEMLELLVDHLLKKAPSSGTATLGNSAGGGGKADGVQVAQRVLELIEVDDFAGILNIATRPGDPPLTKSSPTASMKKNYLKLSLLIHPDKLGRKFDKAASAFQALVRALDQMSSPDVEEESSNAKGSSKNKATSIMRSNEGCKRTRVLCPRCCEPWSERALEGNPDYYYNFLMMGLKQYYCSTCLCEFGCCSASHTCPYCRKTFEYSPDDYHRKITCGNEGCNKKFGFMMFSASDRVLSELKATVFAEQQARAKATAVKQRRAQRANERNVGGADMERAFVLGLEDCCPRCGESLETFSEDEAFQHLRNCTDTKKHVEHAIKKKEIANNNAIKQHKKDLQASVQSAAAWTFLGSNQEQLYLLDDTQLKKQVLESGVVAPINADRAELIDAMASRSGTKSSALVPVVDDISHNSSSSGKKNNSSKRKRISPSLLPPNLHSLEVNDLRAILASHGLLHLAPRSSNKSDLLHLIEGEAVDGIDAENVLLIKDGDQSDNKSQIKKQKHTDETKKSSSAPLSTQPVLIPRKRAIVLSDSDDSDFVDE
jgi:hypothetical protein